MRLTSHFFIAISIAILILGIVFWSSSRSRLVYLDDALLQSQLIRQLAEINASDTQVLQSTQRFQQLLNRVITRYAKQNHVTILRKNAIFAGGIDITPEVRLQISRAMRGKS